MSKIDLSKLLTGANPQAQNADVPSQAEQYLADTGRATRVGLWTLAIGFGGFLLWAAFAPLDEGVPGPGIVAIDTKRKVVQHLSGGIIKEVLVKEGDFVKEGQVLLRLDDAAAKANYEQIRQRYLNLRAAEGRLQAEQRGSGKIEFHPDVIRAAKDPQIRQVVTNQEQLFQSRRSALQADLQGMEENIKGQEALILAYDSMLVNRKSQQALLAEELSNTRELVKDGYAPRNRQLELERMVAESGSTAFELQGNSQRAKRTVAEIRQRIISRQQEYRKEVESHLSEVGRDAQGDVQKFKAATDDLDRIEIKSPSAGQVVGLAFQSVGGVIGPGQKLLDVVPAEQALLIEARVAPHLIDRVKNELPVDVRFNSFAHSPQLVVEGRVISVSGDLLTDPQANSAPYYLARVAVTADGYKKLGNRQLQPGMPVEVIFLTGERSLLKYLLSPLTKRLAASMKEE